MGGIGAAWGVVKMLATKVPWGRLVENAPAVVDLVARAKERLQAPSQDDLAGQLLSIHNQNLRLEKTLHETANRLDALSAKLEAVSQRMSLLLKATVVSLLMAISSLLLWLVK